MALTKITQHVLGVDSDAISEGSTNLFHTTARARGAISVAGGYLTYSSGEVALTQSNIVGSLASQSLSPANITLTGYLRGPSSFTIDPATHGNDTGTVVIAGNLQVDGTTTTINSTTMTVDDLNLVLASGAADSAAANGAGLTIDGASATMLYTHATTSFDFNKPVNVTGTLGVSNKITGVAATNRAALELTGGTASQTYPKIHLLGAGTAVDIIRISNDGGHTLVGTDRNSGGGLAGSSLGYSSVFGSIGATAAHIMTNNSVKMTVLSDGKVGIGETVPLGFLHVKNGDSGQGSVNAAGNSLVLESNGATGITFLSGSSSNTSIIMGDSESNYQGVIIYDHSVNAFKFATAGSERMRIDNAGKVGIGTTTLNKMFNIADPAQGGEALKLHFEASTSSDKWAIYSYDRTNSHYADLSLGQNAIYIKGSDGKVGFGVTSPVAALDLQSDGYGTWPFYVRRSANGAQLAGIYESSEGDGGHGMLYLMDGGGTTDVKLSTNGDSYINGGAGNLFLGMTSGHHAASGRRVFEMSGTSSALIGFDINGTYSTYMFDSGTSGTFEINHPNEVYLNADSKLRFATGTNVEAMTITNNQDVGIGTIAPARRLHIFQTEGSVGAKHAAIQFGGYAAQKTRGPMIAAYRATGNSNDQGFIFSTYNASTAVNDRYKMGHSGKHEFFGVHQGDSVGHFIFSNQQPGTGTGDSTSANCTLMVKNGSCQIQIMPWSTLGARIGTRGGGWNSTGTQDVFFTTNDTVRLTMTHSSGVVSGDLNDTSDERLKKDITTIGDTTTKLKQLNPVNFKWRENDTVSEGFIAQEVEAIFPELVNKGPVLTGDQLDSAGQTSISEVKSINTVGLLAKAIKTIQELEARIATLEG